MLRMLRGLAVDGWVDYKRDRDTARGLYGHGRCTGIPRRAPVTIKAPRWSVGREMDHEADAYGERSSPQPPVPRQASNSSCSLSS
ncbi:hypothetical protein ACFC51_28475 [Streptomyces sp. NPDC055962]|uniref:hypothetical protein n=1 Tax=Streptomyces sp. NPDC055962 TaxID=3345667 RepID=UPI0035E2B189